MNRHEYTKLYSEVFSSSGKRSAESLAYIFATVHKMDIKVARIFNTYGPGMRKDDGRVIPEFIKSVLSGEPINIRGDGSQTRSFCYIDDMVEGLIRLMNLPKQNKLPIVNLGREEEISILLLAELIRELCNSDSEINFVEEIPFDPVRRVPNTTKAMQLLDWKANIPILSGLEITINAFKSR